MKVTAGAMKGKRISAAGVGGASEFGALRATGAKVREAIFNILGPMIEGARFLDLYAGTGAVGMEAMSRGVSQVVFVEADPARAKRLQTLLCDCGCRLKSVIVNRRASEYVIDAAAKGARFDVIFIDPPYHTGELSTVLMAMASSDILSPDGVLLVEHIKKAALPDELGSLRKRKSYKYGDTMLTQYRRLSE